ncbi:MAG: tetratricopeptide repeat protein [Bacteroidales bacterium]|nr:tetratricopeptide repeat protein [Bacteroidales bacterium]MCF8333015.1 tetratricopeptide repeat protein [Bacteroidales bacterium]
MIKNLLVGFVIGTALVMSGCSGDDKKQKAPQESQQKETKNSIEELTRKIKKDTANADLYHRRARQRYENVELNKALSDIGQAIQLEPNNDKHLLLLADIYEAMNKFEDSKEVLERVANRNQRNVEANLKLSRLEFAYENYQRAIMRANRALEIESDNAEAIYLKGYIYLEQNDTAKAIDHFIRSIENEPEFQDPYLQLGKIYSERGDARAVDFFNGALNMNPDDVETLYHLAMHYQEQKKFDKAMRTYRNILAVDSTNAKVYHNMGYMLMIYAEDFDEAIEYFDKAIKHQPGYYQAYYNRGYAHELSEEYQKARADYRKALNIRSNYEKALEGMNRLDNVIY